MRRFVVATAALLLMGLVLVAPPPVMATGSAQIAQNAVFAGVQNITSDAVTINPTTATVIIAWGHVVVTAPSGTTVTIRDVIRPDGTVGPAILVSIEFSTNSITGPRAILLPGATFVIGEMDGTPTMRRLSFTAATARSAPFNFLRRASGHPGTGTGYVYSDIAGANGRGGAIWHPLRA